MTDTDGNIIWQGRYYVWGKLSFEKITRKAPRDFEQNLRMQGQYADRDTDLCYNTFRYYDPDVGRFTCEDPIGLFGGLNLYQYAPNPLMWIDPWEWSCGSNSRRLGRNMGEPKPARHDAHHIVMSNSQDSKMLTLRDMMKKFGIDINDKQNGVMLPKTAADRSPMFLNSATHSNVHTNSYKQSVFDRLSTATNKQDFLSNLADISKGLQKGNF